jgi:hypothetical protein
MIFVATAAVALACVMEFGSQTRFWQTNPWLQSVQVTAWVALPLTLALIPLRLRKPRPRGWRLWCQPGMSAEIAVAVSLAHFLLLRSLSDYLNAARTIVSSPDGLLAQITLLLPSKASCTVAAMWVVLALSGRWKAEKTWIDRTGRILGLYWIVYPIVSLLFAHL